MKGRYQTDSEFIGSEYYDYILDKHGHAGLFIRDFLEKLLWQQEEHCTYRHDKLRLLTVKTRCELSQLEECLSTLIDIGLFQSDGERFWSVAICEDRDRALRKSATNAQNRKGRGKDSSPISTTEERTLTTASRSLTTDEGPSTVDERTKTTAMCMCGVGDCVCDSGRESPRGKPSPKTWVLSEGTVSIDDLTRETLSKKLLENALQTTDLPRALELLARHYHRNPTEWREGCLYFDITAPWILKTIRDERNMPTSTEPSADDLIKLGRSIQAKERRTNP